MRKMVKIFLMFLIFSFFSIFQVKAASLTNNSYCEEALDVEGEPVQICHFVFDVDGTVTYNQNSLSLTLTNVVIKSIQVENGWYYTKVHDNLYTFETSNPTLSGHVEMATIVFQKINEAEECSIHYSCDWSKIDRSCSIFEGNYYGPNGDIITELEYEKQCLKPVCKDYGDGTYSDKNGNLVSKIEYEKQCLPHYCEIIDGIYYGKDGSIVSEDIYNEQCGSKSSYICEIKDGVYYDQEGNVTSQLEYEKQCLSHSCEILSDGTYFDANGNIVSAEEYEISCGIGIDNPQTGSSGIPVFLFLIAGSFIIFIFVYNKKNTKIYRL